MKKYVLLSALIALVLCVPFVMTACYVSNPAPLSKIVGTYELTAFNISNVDEKDSSGNTVVHDQIKENGAVGYLVIKADGTGYQIYKDKNNPLRVLEIKVNYNYDEGSDKVNNIVYYSGVTFNTTESLQNGLPQSPINATEKLGVNFKGLRKKLSFNDPVVFSGKISQNVSYKKVNKAVDLSYVSKKLGKTLIATPYETAGLNGWFEDGAAIYNNNFVYYYVNFKAADKKADIYYAFKQDDVIRQQKTDVDFTYTVSEGAVTIQIDGRTLIYTLNENGGTGTLAQSDEQYIYWNKFTVSTQEDLTLKIDRAIQNYQDYRLWNE